jgi:SRSO17 transposase
VYLVGLCLPGERKSIEPIATRMDPRHISARDQSLRHFVALTPWDDRALLRIADRAVLEQMDRQGGVMAWSVDDSGIPKKGTYSVGVARQHCGNLGKQDNCQVAVSLSLVHEAVSVPAAYRLDLPEEWARDRARRTEAGVPEEPPFRTKWQLALEQIDILRAEGLPEAPIVADAGYGTTVEFREGLTDRGLPYVVGIQSTVTLWPPGKVPLPPAARKRGGRGGRPPTLLRRDAKHRPLDALTLARNLPKEAWEWVA